jgi:hypothetical protein
MSSPLTDLAPGPHIDPSWPVAAAYGAGVDSTAMLIELVESGQRVDVALFADTGDEKAGTYEFLVLFTRWLAERGVPLHVVRYSPTRFKNFPEYGTLYENLLTNGTLPGMVFGRGTCSAKWKIAPQEAWLKSWDLARAAWDLGDRVVRLIGYDSSPADRRRYAHALSLQTDDRYATAIP